MFIENNSIKKTQLEEKVSRKVLGSGGSLMMVEVCFRKDGIGAVHFHIHEQVSYIAQGSFEVTIGDEMKVLRQGDSFYAPGGVPHGVVALEDAKIIDVFTPMRTEFM